MKPILVIGLGNPLMGDDGIGWHVAEGLACHPELPPEVEAIGGGTDLLRLAGEIEGRTAVVVVDAIQDEGEIGEISVFEDLSGLEERQDHAHHLSAAQAIGLLRMVTRARFRLLCISVHGARIGGGLSPELAGRVPAILDRVIQEATKELAPVLCRSSAT